MPIDCPLATTTTAADIERLQHEYDIYARRKQKLSIKASLSSDDVLDVDVTSLVDSYKVKAQLEAATTPQSSPRKSGL